MSAVLRLPQANRRLAAIAFMDVAGYSRLMGLSEEVTLQSWSSIRVEVVGPLIIKWRGRVVNSAGDSLFAEFTSAFDAFQWAVETQAILERAPYADARVKLRIALHLADVIDDAGGDVMGDGVNVAARLQAFAEPGGIIASQSIVDAILGKTGADFADLGVLYLRNIPRPVRAFRLKPRPRREARRWPLRPVLHAAVPAVALVALLAIMLPHLGGWGRNARLQAIVLLQKGLDVSCNDFPCPAALLARRSLFEQAIAADPSFAQPYAEAAITYTNFVISHLSVDRNHDLRVADRLAARALALAPDQAFSQRALAAVYRQDPERIEDALAAYLRAIQLDPDRALTRANAGWMLILLGRAAEAEPYLHAAITMAPHHRYLPAWLTYLGLSKLFLDEPGHGAELFRDAITRQPPGTAAPDIEIERWLALAAALALNGDLLAARQTIDQLRAEHPTLSMDDVLRNCDCSHAPGFLAYVAKLKQATGMAGLANPVQASR